MASSNQDQGWAYRIEKLSNADISDFSVYQRVYRIEPPISSISIILKTSDFFCLFSPKILRKFRKFSENSENSPKILKTHEPKSSTTTTTPKIPKIRQKFRKFAENSLKRRSFLRPKYRIDIVSYREKKPNIVSNEKKRIAQGWS